MWHKVFLNYNLIILIIFLTFFVVPNEFYFVDNYELHRFQNFFTSCKRLREYASRTPF